MKIAYIAETSLTNKSAYTQHVLKMCDAFSQHDHDVILMIPELSKKTNYKNIQEDFLLLSKKKIIIYSILDHKIKNIFSRMLFGIRVVKILNSEKVNLILTRSFITSFFLCISKINHFLEIHSELKSFSKFLLIKLNFINSIYITKVIFISKSLKKYFKLKKNKSIILHDGVDINNYKIKKKFNIIKTAVYVGSFYKGRGIEIIEELAKKFKNIRFNLYGQNNGYKKPYKNIKYFGHISYSKVPKVLRKSQILLMPYSNNVHIRAKNVNTANYCSPLKMFDYLASGGIIISSKLNGICEVLKHKSNAVIVKNYDVKSWIREFKKITKREYDINKLSINSIKTARKNTWYLRVKKIIDLNR